MGKLVTKIITRSNEKVRATVYETLVTAKGESHINNSKKWENNYNIRIDKKQWKFNINNNEDESGTKNKREDDPAHKSNIHEDKFTIQIKHQEKQAL